MKAIVFDGKVCLRKNAPVPKRGKHEVLIRVLKAGICRTDLEIIKGYFQFRGILGHEFVGVVEKGPEQRLLGKRVVGEINLSCGTCPYCTRGIPTHCTSRSVLGIHGKNGCFADYVTLPQKNIHLVPDAVTDDEALFVEPLAASLQILAQAQIRPQDMVIILGDGKLGQLCAQVVTLTGAGVVVVGKHPQKLNLLKQQGIEACTPSERALGKADLLVECTGSPSGLQTALSLVRPQGTIILKSTYQEKPRLDLAPIVINEITIIGSRCGPFFPALRLLEKKAIDVLPLISKRYPLEKALEALQAANQKDTLKVVLEITNEAPKATRG